MDNSLPHILIVDDDLDLLTTLSSFLQAKGFEPTCVRTGNEALSKLESHEFDAALLDLHLGDMNGLDALSQIKARAPETECILLTSQITQASAAKAIEMNAFGYFQKPLDMEQVLRSIHQAVEKHRSIQALRASEARYRAVIYSAIDAIISADSAGKIVGWNPGAERIFGYTESEVINQSLNLLMPACHREEHLAGMARANAGGDKHIIGKTVEIEGVRKDGSEFPMEISLSEWQVAEGKFYTALTRDITARKQAENAQRVSEINLNKAQHYAHVGSWAWDIKNNQLKWSDEMYRIFGVDRETFTGSLADIVAHSIHPDDREKVEASNRRVSEDGKPVPLEYRVVQQNGTIRTVWAEAGEMIFDEAGNPSLLSGIVQDITERKRTEEKLQESEARYRRLVEGAPDIVYTFSSKHGGIYYSPHTEQILGYSIKYLYENPYLWNESIHPEDVNQITEAIREFEYGKPFDIEYRIRNAQGNWLWLRDRSIGRYVNGDEVLIEGLAADITEQKMADEKLRESEARWQFALEGAGDGVWDWDVTSNSVFFSRQWKTMFGYAEDEIENTLDEWDKRVHPDDKPQCYADLQKHFAGETPMYQNEHRVLCKDGTYKWILDRGKVIKWSEDQKPGRVIGTHTDITERKLREEKNYMQMIALESAANGITITDKNGSIEWVNPAWCALTGYAKEETIGKNPRILKSGVQDKAFYKNMWDTILAGKVWRGELVNKRKDGSLYTEEETITPVLDEHGEIKNFIAIKQDITERKHAENTLARTNLRLQSLRVIDHALLGASIEGGSADIEALRHLAALVPCGNIKIIALDEISDSARIVARAAGEKLSVSRANESISINELRLKDLRDEEMGVEKIGADNLNPFEKRLYDEGRRSIVKAPLIIQGKLIGLLVLSAASPDFFIMEYLEIIKDVSAQLALSLHHENLISEIRRHAEQLEYRVQERTAEIEATRQRLELAVNAGEIGVWEANFKKNTLSWDDRMHLIHGTTPDQFTTTVEAWWQMIHPQDAARSQRQFQEALEQTGLFTDEHRILRPDGTVHYISASAIVLYDADHQPGRMIGVNADVTHRKEVEETMIRANLEMERALRIKDEFLANMSHELRTPLNAIMGISESLLEQTIGKLNEKQQKYIATINESGVHLLSLINDILDLSKIEAGRMELTITDVSVKSLFESSFRMVKEMAQKKTVSISFEADERVQTLRGDLRRLMQMLVNLLSNAVKFTPAGGKAGVQVTTNADMDQINITVWDTGIGISDEDMPRLFKSFVQLDSKLSREHSGTGLGLMLVMQMARMHSGNISVQSKPNEGSRFTITLPWSQVQENSAGGKKIDETEPVQPSKKMREANILLMEDTESTALFINDYLQGQGYQILIAHDGLSGTLMAQHAPPDIILLDIQMPGMDGFEVIEKLHADPALKNIPVIALTALAMPGDRERCLAAGMDDYMSKPIHLKDLTKMIQQHLEIREKGK